MTVSEVDTIDNEVEVNNELPPPHIQDMIQHAMDNEYTKANNVFNDLMTVKLNDLLDQEEIRLADTIYNGVDDEEDNPDQLELDLETEDESESDEETDEEDDEV